MDHSERSLVCEINSTGLLSFLFWSFVCLVKNLLKHILFGSFDLTRKNFEAKDSRRNAEQHWKCSYIWHVVQIRSLTTAN